MLRQEASYSNFSSPVTPSTQPRPSLTIRPQGSTFPASANFTGANSTVTDLTEAAFKNYANGDYRPKRGGALFNAGDNALYSSYAISTTDLDGAPRIQGKIIDIGCWEAATGIGSVYYIR